MDDGWDLYAVVRGCTSVIPAATAVGNKDSGVQLPTSIAHQDHVFPAPSSYCFRDLISPQWKERSADHGPHGHDPHKSPECRRITIPAQSLPNVHHSPLPILGGLPDPAPKQKPMELQPPQQAEMRPKQQPFCFGNASNTAASHNPSMRSKKRKNHAKRVCHVAAENLSSGVWSWRKYGQKPIKGSPYPRGYYRCSTSKGCLARKQVERSKSDPGMFIVTYTAEHNHPTPANRNSLAGTTRHKPSEGPHSDGLAKAPATPDVSPEASRSFALGKAGSGGGEDPPEEGGGNGDSVGNSKTDLWEDEDPFAGLEDFTAGVDRFPARVEVSWLASNAATIAGGS